MSNQKSQPLFDFSSNDLLDFPRDLGEQGWFQFYKDRKNYFQHIEKKFEVPLNKKARVFLREEKNFFEGMLTLDSVKMPEPDAAEILLRIGKKSFSSGQIKKIMLI